MPQIHINLSKIKYNAMVLQHMLAEQGIRMIPVTKCMGGDPKVRQQFREMGFNTLAESRLTAMMTNEQHPTEHDMMIKGHCQMKSTMLFAIVKSASKQNWRRFARSVTKRLHKA